MSSANRISKAARFYVDLGWHLFPVWARSKQPVTANGYKDAALSAEHWQSNPDANIGLACGLSGLIALDYDPAKTDEDGRALAESLLERHRTTTQLTPTGGYHLIFRLPLEVELSNSPGQLPAGWDVRVNGYILLAPSRVVYRGEEARVKRVEDGHEGGYEWLEGRWPHECPPEPLPDHVLAMLKPKRERQAINLNGNGKTSESRSNAYADAALRGELDTLARTPQGYRNDQLNTSAFNLGQLVAGGALDEFTVRSSLEAAALAIGLEEREVKRTIESGLGDGKQYPRTAPEEPELTYGNNGEAATGSKKRQAKFDSQKVLDTLAQLGYAFAWNELDDSIEVNGDRIDNGLSAQIRTRMRDLGYKRIEAVEDTYTAHAYEHRYHPIKRYLSNLTWDGSNQIAALCRYVEDSHPLIEYVDGGKVPVFNVWLSRWMIGSIAKIFKTGAVRGQNPMLVLDGGQNLGKSTFCKWLASPLPDLFIEDAIRADDKEHHRYLASKWIWEVAELGATTRRQDQEAIKSFLTKHEVTFRKPYDRHPIVKPAIASFIGTINNEAGFLTDKTGNRRFLPVTLTGIDWQYVDNIDVHQLWAQAYALYDKGESWALTPTEAKYRDGLNEGYEMEEPLEGWIMKECDIDHDNKNWITTTSDIVATLQNAGVTGGTRAIQMQVANTLRGMGLSQHHARRPRAWLGIRIKPFTPTYTNHTPTIE